MEPKIHFDLSPAGSYVQDNCRIYPNSKCFKAGDYPDKHITVDNSDLKARVQRFTPVHLNLEHVPTDDVDSAISILFGEVGTIQSMWIDPDHPEWAMGCVSIPEWVDKKLRIRGVSMEVPHIPGMPFTGAALTYHPRITGAALMSDSPENIADLMGAYMARPKKERHDTMEGQSAIQKIHDVTAARGAVCDDPNSDKKMSRCADFVSKHEQKALQTIHDMTLGDGASCMSYNSEAYYSDEEIPTNMTLKELMALVKGQGIVLTDVPEEKTDKSVEFTARIAELEKLANEAQMKADAEKLRADNADLELKKVKDTETAKFTEDNKKAIAKLVAEFKVSAADSDQAEKDRAKDPETYDRLAIHFATIKHTGGGSTGHTNMGNVEFHVSETAKNAPKIDNDIRALKASGIYN